MYQLEVECEYWLEKANEYVQGYVEQSDYDWLFEADQSTENNNQKIKNNTDTAIGNAARAVIKMIENLLSKIRNWLQKKFSKERFATIQQNLQKSGKGNTQVKTANTNKIKNVWNSIFKRVDDEVKKCEQEVQSAPNEANSNDNDSENIDDSATSIVDDIENMVKDKLDGLGTDFSDIGNIGSAWVTTLTAEAALRAATTDAQTAEDILSVLENDKKLMEKLERDLGQARAKSYKRKIKSLSKNISLVRLRAKLRGQYTDSLFDAAGSVIEDVEHIMQNGLIGVRSDAINGLFTTKSSNEERLKATRRTDLAGKLVTNPNTGKSVGGVVRVANKAYRHGEQLRRFTGSDVDKRKKFLDTLLHGSNSNSE